MTFDVSEYVLSPDVLRERFATRILPQLTAAPSPAPTAIVLGAQPGAGMTVALDHLLGSHPEPVVALFADDFRAAHPAFESLMATQPQNMPAATSQASGAWLHMAIEHGIENRWNIAWETTFRSTEALAADLGTAAAAGYRVEVSALAVPRAESLLRTVERCINQGPAGRVVHVEDHDAPYHQAPKTLARLAEINNVDVRVLDTNLNQLHPSNRYLSAVDALKAGRVLQPGAASRLDARVAAARFTTRWTNPPNGRTCVAQQPQRRGSRDTILSRATLHCPRAGAAPTDARARTKAGSLRVWCWWLWPDCGVVWAAVDSAPHV